MKKLILCLCALSLKLHATDARHSGTFPQVVSPQIALDPATGQVVGRPIASRIAFSTIDHKGRQINVVEDSYKLLTHNGLPNKFATPFKQKPDIPTCTVIHFFNDRGINHSLAARGFNEVGKFETGIFLNGEPDVVGLGIGSVVPCEIADSTFGACQLSMDEWGLAHWEHIAYKGPFFAFRPGKKPPIAEIDFENQRLKPITKISDEIKQTFLGGFSNSDPWSITQHFPDLYSSGGLTDIISQEELSNVLGPLVIPQAVQNYASQQLQQTIRQQQQQQQAERAKQDPLLRQGRELQGQTPPANGASTSDDQTAANAAAAIERGKAEKDAAAQAGARANPPPAANAGAANPPPATPTPTPTLPPANP